jgi:nucleoside-diphosphate-sugar epimerase
VRAFVRPGSAAAVPSGREAVEGDAFDPDSMVAAAAGADVLVHALNPPYPRWAEELPRLTASVLAAAEASGAAVMIPGNVYIYGADMPEVLREDTPAAPTSRKGRLRVEMERAFEDAARDGVRTVILRAGDFIEREKTGNWFDTHIAAKAAEGRVVYPGPRDKVHAWAYLPDMARAMAALADKRGEFAPYEVFNFEGYSLTGDELIAAIERAVGRPLKVGSVPWPAMRVMALFDPMIREVLEMRYLWNVPHRLDGTKLAAALPEFRATPLDEAMADAVPQST